MPITHTKYTNDHFPCKSDSEVIPIFGGRICIILVYRV